MPIPAPVKTLAITCLLVPTILSQTYGELHRYPWKWDLVQPTTWHSAVPVAAVDSPQRPQLSCSRSIWEGTHSLWCSWAAHRFGPQAPKPRSAFPWVRCTHKVSRQLPCSRHPWEPGWSWYAQSSPLQDSRPATYRVPRMPSCGTLEERNIYKPMFKMFSLSRLLLFSCSTSNYFSWVIGLGFEHCPSSVFPRFMMSGLVLLWTMSTVKEKW